MTVKQPSATNRDLIESDAVLKVALQLVKRAHDPLETLQRQAGTIAQSLRHLTAEITRDDAFHDRKARGIHSGISARADLVGGEEAEPYTSLLSALYPLGLSITQRTYREQAAAAARARHQLTPAARAILSEIVFGGRTLLEEVEEWLDTAERIGKMHSERTRLAGDSDDDTVSQGDLRKARMAWIRATHTFLNLLDYSDFDADTRRRLLADLRDAVARARTRAKSEPSVDLDAPALDAADFGASIQPQPQLPLRPEDIDLDQPSQPDQL